MANTSNHTQALSECTGIPLTEGALALVEEVVERTKVTDEKELVGIVCAELERRFSNGKAKKDEGYEYHLSQMHLETTSAVARTISCYFISKKMFPKISFRKSTYIRKTPPKEKVFDY